MVIPFFIVCFVSELHILDPHLGSNGFFFLLKRKKKILLMDSEFLTGDCFLDQILPSNT